jgi:hypothetical protein
LFTDVATSVAPSVEWKPLQYLWLALFMVGFGALLVWIGWTYLRPEPQHEVMAERWSDVERWVVKSRRAVELLAATGCGLMLAHAIALCSGVRWPSAALVWIVSIAPVFTGLLTLGIVAPGAYRYNPLASEAWDRWSPGNRFVVKMILRIGWLGNIAVLATLYHLHMNVLGPLRLAAEVMASALILLLYASQVLVLHFGQIRELEPNSGRLPERS